MSKLPVMFRDRMVSPPEMLFQTVGPTTKSRKLPACIARSGMLKSLYQELVSLSSNPAFEEL